RVRCPVAHRTPTHIARGPINGVQSVALHRPVEGLADRVRLPRVAVRRAEHEVVLTPSGSDEHPNLELPGSVSYAHRSSSYGVLSGATETNFSFAGRAPYLSASASWRASPSVKFPVICTSRPVMPGLIFGADCTTLSSSIAMSWFT